MGHAKPACRRAGRPERDLRRAEGWPWLGICGCPDRICASVGAGVGGGAGKTADRQASPLPPQARGGGSRALFVEGACDLPVGA